MHTIAFYNLKGGVGKTAAAVNVAYLAAAGGLPTLFWDLDTQGAASWYLGVKPQLEGKAKKVLRGKEPVGRQVRRSPYPNLDVIPADLAYRDMDLILNKADSADVLSGLLAPFAETYGLVVLDCPPSFSRVSENVFAAADQVLVPVIPTPLSLRAYEQLKEHYAREKLPKKRLRPFFSLVDRRRKLHRDWLAEPPAALDRLLTSAIPYAAAVERMGTEQAPLPVYAPRAPVAQAYRGLWEEVRKGL